tara:strand:+ start:313 stop:615 length:303 start_codon:yes stop_codon:yes gene_type:complete
MPLFTFVGKSKDWEEQFKKEFGGLPSDATLDDVVKHKANIMGNHVSGFMKEKANEQKKISSGYKHKINSKCDQETSKGEEKNVIKSIKHLHESTIEKKCK